MQVWVVAALGIWHDRDDDSLKCCITRPVWHTKASLTMTGCSGGNGLDVIQGNIVIMERTCTMVSGILR